MCSEQKDLGKKQTNKQITSTERTVSVTENFLITDHYVKVAVAAMKVQLNKTKKRKEKKKLNN